MQLAAAGVSVYEQRLDPGIGKRQRQVGRHERLAVTRPRAGDGNGHGARGTVCVGQPHPYPPQRLYYLQRVIPLEPFAVPGALDLGNCAKDREPQLVAYLFRITHPAVEPVEQNSPTHSQPHTGQHNHHGKPLRGAGHWAPRHHGRIQDPHVRHRAGLGQPCLLIS